MTDSMLAGQIDNAEVVILAQASMAGATERCAALSVLILSSPLPGLEAAVAAYRSASTTYDLW